MQTLATLVGIASGFALMGHHQAAATLLATSLAVDAALAPLTVVIAARRGRSVARWSVLGFIFGMWALAFVLLVRHGAPNNVKPAEPSSYRPNPDAA